MRPTIVPLLLLVAGVALLADRRAGAVHGLVGGGCVGLAGMFTAGLALAGPALGVWVMGRQRSVRGVAAGVLAMMASMAPLAGWTARSVYMDMGWLPTVAPVVALLDADAAVRDATAEAVEVDPLAEQPFGPTASAMNLSNANRRTAGASSVEVEVEADRPWALIVSNLAGHPSATLAYAASGAVRPLLDDRSATLHALVGLTPPDGSATQRWMAGDRLLRESPSPAADATALTVVASAIAMLGLVPFGLAIAAWRRRWSGLLLVGTASAALLAAVLVTPDAHDLLPLTMAALALAISGLAARPQPGKPRAPRAKRMKKRTARPEPAEPIDDEPRLGPIPKPVAMPAVAPEPDPEPIAVVPAAADRPAGQADADPAPLGPTSASSKTSKPEPRDRTDDADGSESGFRLPRLPSVGKLAASYDVPEDEATPETRLRPTGRPI